MGHIILEAKIVTESGVLFSVVSRQKASAGGASEGSEIFYHNNDYGFWSGVKDYVPPPVKKKVFIIMWLSPSGYIMPVADQSEKGSFDLANSFNWIPLKGFEVEYYVPQLSN